MRFRLVVSSTSRPRALMTGRRTEGSRSRAMRSAVRARSCICSRSTSPAMNSLWARCTSTIGGTTSRAPSGSRRWPGRPAGRRRAPPSSAGRPQAAQQQLAQRHARASRITNATVTALTTKATAIASAARAHAAGSWRRAAGGQLPDDLRRPQRDGDLGDVEDELGGRDPAHELPGQGARGGAERGRARRCEHDRRDPHRVGEPEALDLAAARQVERQLIGERARRARARGGDPADAGRAGPRRDGVATPAAPATATAPTSARPAAGGAQRRAAASLPRPRSPSTARPSSGRPSSARRSPPPRPARAPVRGVPGQQRARAAGPRRRRRRAADLGHARRPGRRRPRRRRPRVRGQRGVPGGSRARPPRRSAVGQAVAVASATGAPPRPPRASRAPVERPSGRRGRGRASHAPEPLRRAVTAARPRRSARRRAGGAGQAAARGAIRAALTCSGVMPGLASIIRAATPATTAAAWDVPLPLNSWSPTRAPARSASTVEPGARSETTRRPGASRSGLRSRATVAELEKGATLSSPSAAVPPTSAAPTVITDGSSPGVTVPGPGPRCPPPPRRRGRRDRALDGGGQRVRVDGRYGVRAPRQGHDADAVAVAVRHDPAQRGDHGRGVRRAVPARDLDGDQVASGAAPSWDSSTLPAPAIRPATWVPWPSRSRPSWSSVKSTRASSRPEVDVRRHARVDWRR